MQRNETAFLKETISFDPLKPNLPLVAECDLSLFDRATDVADNYQEYRITKLEWRYVPEYDTYIDASGNVSLPNLYAKRLSYSAPISFSIDWLKTMGAKPRRLDDKTLLVSYTPNTYIAGLSGATGGNKPIWKPWLATHNDPGTGIVMDKTPHYGHAFFITQNQAGAGNSVVAELELTAYFEFRKPWDKNTIPPPGTSLSAKVQKASAN